jgi:hypothetical protein
MTAEWALARIPHQHFVFVKPPKLTDGQAFSAFAFKTWVCPTALRLQRRIFECACSIQFTLRPSEFSTIQILPVWNPAFERILVIVAACIAIQIRSLLWSERTVRTDSSSDAMNLVPILEQVRTVMKKEIRENLKGNYRRRQISLRCAL